ncbi:ninjurin-A isoform X1 [Pieris napi]|uniref:ninjurin-A isoform X1 n=1 Tax=Pieris napi TaxID=78633 RepID=UPI001FBB1469|nr:ninjurin-A isoform X1 [Pieris napi]
MENNNQKDAPKSKVDLNDVEMVFGTPTSPKSPRPDIIIENEKSPNKNTDKKHGTENETEGSHQTQPLLESDKQPQSPPLTGPEIDDLDIPHADATPYPGIDDGLLEPGDKMEPHDKHDSEKPEHEGSDHSTREDGVGTVDGKWPYPDTDEPDYPYDGANGFGYRFNVDDRPGSPIPGSIPDVNTYQQKKNLAQGMMDLALLSANANQLRYVLESASSHPYYYPSLTFIAMSIVLQIAVGVGLIMNSRYNVKDDKDICKADKINNFTVLGVFLITIVNVFITSFSVATPNVPGTSVVVASTGSG